MTRYALTAIGRDRPGIVAAVTKALFENNANIEDSSMTRLEDEFAIILIMSMEPGNLERLETGLNKAEALLDLTVSVKEMPPEGARGPQSNFIITLHGADRTGIVYRTAEALSRLGVNITELETAVTGGDKKIYIMLLEVYSPPGVGLDRLADEMKRLEAELEVSIKIKPIEEYEPL